MNSTMTKNDWIGRTIDGRFPLLECLGESGQEVVFRTALQDAQQGKAAIRLIRFDAESANSRNEVIKAASKLSHPHLMRIFHSGHCEIDGVGHLYVVTEFAEESLSGVIPERPLTADETREMLSPILDALSYLHASGLAYGHLKPTNILVVGNQLKLPVDNLPVANSHGKRLAELQIYDAPEVATGAISPASDVWSLGVTLVEALTQHLPLWDRSAKVDPTVPSSVPEPFADIARGCLRVDAGNRSSLRAIRAALDPSKSIPQVESLNKGAPVTPISSPAATPPPQKVPRFRAALLIAALAIVAVIVGFLVAPSRRTQSSSPSAATQPAESAPATTSQAPAAPPAPQPEAPAIRPSTGSTTKGEVADRVSPDVPASATRTIHGKIDVRVRVSVDSGGVVSGASFEYPGHSKYFANQALSAARKWKFKPPEVSGAAVSSKWILHFQFRRDGTDINATEVSP